MYYNQNREKTYKNKQEQAKKNSEKRRKIKLTKFLLILSDSNSEIPVVRITFESGHFYYLFYRLVSRCHKAVKWFYDKLCLYLSPFSSLFHDL